MLNHKSTTNPSSRWGKTDLPARITKAASKQTYYTFRFIVDRQQVQDAFRSYAYFRWVDDQLDYDTGTQSEKLAFLNRQRQLLDECYRKESNFAVSPEEQMLVDMIANDHEESSGQQAYLRNMMAVMSFDAQRKSRLITQAELTQYSHLLSVAVTELLFYFIGHENPSAHSAGRYQAVQGAHIVHMLRDMLVDIDCGYINVPAETLQEGSVSLDNLDTPAFRRWVEERVRLARRCFSIGRMYFEKVKDLRCRLAAYAYIARFEWMLRVIERDGYHLRRAYPERKSLRAGVWMGWRVFVSVLKIAIQEKSDRGVVLSKQAEE